MEFETKTLRPTFTYDTDPEKIKLLVLEILSVEADEIPKETIKSLDWKLEEIPLSNITVNEMIARHEQDPIHIKRAENIEQAIRNNIPFPPLIVMYQNHFLVDGYTRYRVFKRLNLTTIPVYFGK